MTQESDEFWQLPDHEKRLAVATDVLEQAGTGKYAAQRGMYAHVYAKIADVAPENIDQKIINDNDYQCIACAVGACLLSTIRLGNRFTLPSVSVNFPSFFDFLTQVFTPKQLFVLEWLFELGDGEMFCIDGEGRISARRKSDGAIEIVTIPFSDKELEQLHRCRELLLDLSAYDRLKFLMQNIIDHDGELVI